MFIQLDKFDVFCLFIGIALVEEGSKFSFLKNFFSPKEFNEPFDGIIYAVMISLGFAVENFMYVLEVKTAFMLHLSGCFLLCLYMQRVLLWVTM